MTAGENQEGGLSVREQIERYRTAFVAVVTMIVIAAAVGGYILAHENFKLPGWVPVLGSNFYTLKADFQTAQAVTPGQGQAVTIAGAKIGEIQSVDLNRGIATVTMRITPKYAHFYRNATLLLRPKTQLQDITVEVSPGTPSAGKLRSGEVIPLDQTDPNVDFDEFLAGFDGETRAALQELLAGAGVALDHNGRPLSAALKRFEPAARYGQQIASALVARNRELQLSIHYFRQLTEALGGKDTQIAQLVDASNAVFETFAKEEANLQSTLQLLPGALNKTGVNLAKLSTASKALAPALKKLQPFARELAPANEATRRLAEKTTPIIKNQIRPFARQILPTVNELQPATGKLSEAFPNFASSLAVLNEFFNELAYNPGPGKAGFLFYLDWGNHNLNSVVSSADAHGPLGRSLLYFNCSVAKIIKGAATVNPTVNLLVGLLKPPTPHECAVDNLITPAEAAASEASEKAEAAAPASARGRSQAAPGGVLAAGLSGQPFAGATTKPSTGAEGG
jgi:phospholipid/cholesterol/gamma-HCH transport system substrate-binding protein